MILGATVVGGLICAAVLKPAVSPRSMPCRSRCWPSAPTWIRGSRPNPSARDVCQPGPGIDRQRLVPRTCPGMGFVNALKKGTNYILSFLVVFLFTQNIGGLIGSALFGTFVSLREIPFERHLVEHLVSDALLVASVSPSSPPHMPRP